MITKERIKRLQNKMFREIAEEIPKINCVAGKAIVDICILLQTITDPEGMLTALEKSAGGEGGGPLSSLLESVNGLREGFYVVVEAEHIEGVLQDVENNSSIKWPKGELPTEHVTQEDQYLFASPNGKGYELLEHPIDDSVKQALENGFVKLSDYAAFIAKCAELCPKLTTEESANA